MMHHYPRDPRPIRLHRDEPERPWYELAAYACFYLSVLGMGVLAARAWTLDIAREALR